jgi:hypothetical protein
MNPTPRTRLLPTALLFAWLAACASDAPADTVFDSSAGLVVVDVAGDGFARCGGRRLPLDAVILELRQRTRAMSEDELARFLVRIRVDRQEEGSAAARRAADGFNRLLLELDLMEVGQVECR